MGAAHRLARQGRTRGPSAGRGRGMSAERWAARGVSCRTDQARARLTWGRNAGHATNYAEAKRQLSKDGAISPAALASPLEGSPKMPYAAGIGPKVLLGSPPPGVLTSGKRKQTKGGETGTHRPWSPSPHSDSPPQRPPQPPRRYCSPWWWPR